MKIGWQVFLWVCLSSVAFAEGEVSVPLSEYSQLVEAVDQSKVAPFGHGVSDSKVSVTVSAEKDHYKATVTATFKVQTYNNRWVSVPVLDNSVAVKSIRVNRRSVQLSQTDDHWVWVTNKVGTHHVTLTYEVNAQSTITGFKLPVALPIAAASQLTATIPLKFTEAGLDSGAVVTSRVVANQTQLQATVSGVDMVSLTWTQPVTDSYAISRAHYSGVREDDALHMTAEYAVQVFRSEQIQLPLLPKTAILQDVRVDGEQAIVLVKDESFATLIQGKGLHKITVQFQVPIDTENGPPVVRLNLPEVPVSRFSIRLPGDQEVSVTPKANVHNHFDEKDTLATVNLPMAKQVAFTWAEAIPEEVQEEVRANASIYHSLYAEEGVMYGTVNVVYDITRGETSNIEILVPESAQINRIESASGGVSDWREADAKAGFKLVTLFLDRKIKGEFGFKVYFERILDVEKLRNEAISVPLVKANNVHRQRGMVALLSNTELALKPVVVERINKVGENQLPAFVRQDISMIIAHTYKYADANPMLTVQGVAPERKLGQFDAQVDTLVSIGDVTLKGDASIAINVKSGNVMALQLKLPEGVSVLTLTAPSLRTYKVNTVEGHQVVDVEFTQELEGQFRLALNYERILSDIGSDTQVPTVSVIGAEVEHGQIAVEALSAVEVQATQHEQLSSVDVNELPQQLVLKTSNPILLAYRYVQVDPPYQLSLKVTRHQELDVQVATIEQANYQTLLTADGLAVTTANFRIRNSRKQFLRLQLPENAQVWSVFLDGKAEKPAKASDDANTVLIKMKNSTHGFTLKVVYAVQQAALEDSGEVAMALPKPDMVVTHSQWHLYLPE
ncbi:MAG: hypothetical protein HOM11_16980, partial [Methylococcales bacterium]|nr:hypothetical protein [Methylococcales bacterium]